MFFFICNKKIGKRSPFTNIPGKCSTLWTPPPYGEQVTAVESQTFGRTELYRETFTCTPRMKLQPQLSCRNNFNLLKVHHNEDFDCSSRFGVNCVNTWFHLMTLRGTESYQHFCHHSSFHLKKGTLLNVNVNKQQKWGLHSVFLTTTNWILIKTFAKLMFSIFWNLLLCNLLARCYISWHLSRCNRNHQQEPVLGHLLALARDTHKTPTHKNLFYCGPGGKTNSTWYLSSNHHVNVGYYCATFNQSTKYPGEH